LITLLKRIKMTMLGLLAQVKPFVLFKKGLIDNATFRLHYKFSFGLLCLASLLTTLKENFGAPIDCLVDKDSVPKDMFKAYCWVHGTFTLPSQLTGKQGRDFAYPGVGPYSRVQDTDLVAVTDDGDEIRHAWYQWVVFVLFFQAILFYLPHYLWKNWEGGKLSLLLQGLDQLSLEGVEGTQEKRRKIVNYVMSNLRSHNIYVYKFILCELLNLVNVFGQMWLMDVFFGGQFTLYGLEVVRLTGQNMEERVDPMARVFPKMTKCTFHRYGPSGSIVNHDGLCILPINVINEKIYVFLWFWFLLLVSWTSIFLCFRATTVFSRYCRYLVFCSRSKSSNCTDIAIVMDRLWFGDWFILMQLCKNMDPIVFHELVLDLKEKMEPVESASSYPSMEKALSKMRTAPRVPHITP